KNLKLAGQGLDSIMKQLENDSNHEKEELVIEMLNSNWPKFRLNPGTKFSTIECLSIKEVMPKQTGAELEPELKITLYLPTEQNTKTFPRYFSEKESISKLFC
ncbi:hypothetical protein SK128_018048, partial [Halocaridina rubra]